MTMNPLIKSRWVEALRSGEYRQGYGKLRSEDYACALGVLCYLAVEDGVIALHYSRCGTPKGFTNVRPVYDGSLPPGSEMYNATLPKEVQKWAELPSDDPELRTLIPIGGGEKALADRPISSLNDARALTFDEIAKLIDDQL